MKIQNGNMAAEYMAKISALETEVVELTGLVTQREVVANVKGSELERCKGQMKWLDDKVSRMGKQKDDMERRCAQMEGEVEAEKARKEEVSKECLAMHTALEQKASSVREMERLRDDCQRETQQWKATVDSLTAEIDSIRDKGHSDAESELKAMKDLYENRTKVVEKERNALREENSNLRKNVERIMAENSDNYAVIESQKRDVFKNKNRVYSIQQSMGMKK